MNKRKSNNNAFGIALFDEEYQFKNDQKPAPLATGPSELSKALCETTLSFRGRVPKTLASQLTRYTKDHYHETVSRKALNGILYVFSVRITKRGGDNSDIFAMKKSIASSLQLSINKLEDHINTMPKRALPIDNISRPHEKKIIEEMILTAKEILEEDGFKRAHFTHIKHEASHILKIVQSDPELKETSTHKKLCEEGFPQQAIRNMANNNNSRLAFHTLIFTN